MNIFKNLYFNISYIYGKIIIDLSFKYKKNLFEKEEEEAKKKAEEDKKKAEEEARKIAEEDDYDDDEW